MIIMPNIKLDDIYKELRKIEHTMATKEQLESLTDTFEILSNKKTLDNIEKSAEDKKGKKIKRIDSVKDLLEEM